MSEGCVCVNDFEVVAREKLSKSIVGYFNSGATDEQTKKDNRDAFLRWRFQPRVLRDVSNVDTSTTILGTKISFPVCVAPTAMSKLASENGELDAARAAAALGTGYTLSSWATTCIEEIAEEVPAVLRWFQLYMHKDRNLTKRLVCRAEKNGYSAVFVTVDVPAPGRRYENMRHKFVPPPDIVLKNFEAEIGEKNGEKNSEVSDYVSSLIDPSLTWADIDWLRSVTNLPIVVKGILTPEMALEALDHGVDGILVSNHGGRQLDGTLASIDALPRVVKAVNGRCEVYMDGGIRSGGDVAKAIALGAKAVFIGRPMVWGIACDGEAGGRRVLEILRDEFELTLKLLGVRSVAELQSVSNLVIHETKILAKL